jgi:hypothetical protein
MPRLGVPKAYAQQQGRDGKAANPEQPGDAVAGVVADIKNGSHRLAYAGNDQKPQAREDNCTRFHRFTWK